MLAEPIAQPLRATLGMLATLTTRAWGDRRSRGSNSSVKRNGPM